MRWVEIFEVEMKGMKPGKSSKSSILFKSNQAINVVFQLSRAALGFFLPNGIFIFFKKVTKETLGNMYYLLDFSKFT